jgi:hypothetical protein
MQQHPVKRMREEALDTSGNTEHPMRQEVRKLCGTYNLSATFSEDTGTLSTLKTPGLIAVKCVLSKDGKPVGVGHGSSVISRINKGIERSIFGCLNGALMSAINSACKTFDSLRLEEADAQKGQSPYAYNIPSEPMGITTKQRSYLLELVNNLSDSEERDRWMGQIDSLSKEDASEAIQMLAK